MAALGRIGRHDTHRSVQAIRLERRQEADLRRVAFFMAMGLVFPHLRFLRTNRRITSQIIILRHRLTGLLVVGDDPIFPKIPCLE
jgi:hypothetical protein